MFCTLLCRGNYFNPCFVSLTRDMNAGEGPKKKRKVKMNCIRIHNTSISLAILMGLSSFSHIASAQSLDLQKKTTNYFLQILKAQQKALEKDNECFIKSTTENTKCETIKAKLLTLVDLPPYQ